MAMTTIAISTTVRENIKSLGFKGETYDDILKRLCASATDQQIRDILMSENGTIPVAEALQEAKERWQK